MAVTREGIPIRCWTFPGTASDQVLLRQVKDDLREWRLHRVIWVLDTGFTSEENRRYLQRAGGHFIIGEKLRAGHANAAALTLPGRYRTVSDNLQVKQVWIGEGEMRRRFVVCRNPHEAERDAARRAKALEWIADELAALERKRTAEDRRDAEALLLAHPTRGRYLTRRRGRLVVDAAKVKAEERVDGKFLLSTSDDSLSVEDVALGYKQLLEVERGARLQARARPAPDLPPQGRAHPRPRAALLPRAAAHPRRRSPGPGHLADHPPRTRAPAPRRVRRFRRPRAPAHRDHPHPTRHPHRARQPLEIERNERQDATRHN
jgi:hypothetical protein